MKNILIALLFFSFGLNAQNTIQGNVKNATGENLIGASVFIKSSDYATITDDFGNFTLESVKTGDYTLKVTYLGYFSYETEIKVSGKYDIDIILEPNRFAIEDVVIRANALEDKSPFSYTQVDKEAIERKNLAQDVPVLLEHNPSMVVTSDAGAGVGYTTMRIRGSDATRINVTINGVPLNDSESHGVFWVNMPDFSSSVNDIQIQRGVGPSTNGAAAFGATVAMNTNNVAENPLIKFSSTYGSFNTQRYSVSATTGLIENKFNIEGRYSVIKSDGYVDRASSDLRSYYFSASYLTDNSSLRFNTFSGSERTYQSWWGVPEAKLTGDDEALLEHYFNNVGGTYQTVADSINLFESDRRYNYYNYENQVDDYGQDHYQLIWNKTINDAWSFSAIGHYTRGKGFFEEYRVEDDVADYGLGPFTDANGNEISTSDLVRRRWLDNHFYGVIFNNALTLNEKSDLLVGISANRYDGDHFGNVIWADRFAVEDPTFRYYESDGSKTDYNAYVKYNVTLGDKLELFADIQNRYIEYNTMGNDNDGTPIDVDTTYNFINPKLGLSYQTDQRNIFYASVASAQREPVRSDFLDAVGTRVPKHEQLWDVEAGWRRTDEKGSISANLFYMLYNNQLVVTGAVNDVGAAVRTNVDDSYRLGIEIEAARRLSEKLVWSGNLALSRNKISSFTEVIRDFGNGTEILNDFENTDIAFSPDIVAASIFSYRPAKNIEAQLLSKYVGRQFLDNTSNENKAIDAYLVNDIVLSYTPEIQGFQQVDFKLILNNVLDAQYSANGYTFSYVFGDLIEENFFYPQAGFNFLLGATVAF